MATGINSTDADLLHHSCTCIACDAVHPQPQATSLPATEQKVGAVIITALDEVAWLLNLRGGDVDYNPVFISYVVVTPDAATLYVNSAKVCGIATCAMFRRLMMRPEWLLPCHDVVGTVNGTYSTTLWCSNAHR